MIDSDRKEFAQVISLAMEVRGTLKAGESPSRSALNLWWALLSPYSLPVVKRAVSACLRDSKRVLHFQPSLVLEKIYAQDGHPPPNEAWSIALKSFDEEDTCVITDEILLGRASAREVYAGGDKVGARMAFLAAYERAVEASREAGRCAKWRLSFGHSPRMRVDAARNAIADGRLSQADVPPGLLDFDESFSPAKLIDEMKRRGLIEAKRGDDDRGGPPGGGLQRMIEIISTCGEKEAM